MRSLAISLLSSIPAQLFQTAPCFGAPNLSSGDFPTYQPEIEIYTRQGTVFAFGSYPGKSGRQGTDGSGNAAGSICFCSIRSKRSPGDFRYLNRIEVKVFPATIRRPSQRSKLAGITHAERFIDASTLKTEEDIEEAVLNYTVFGV